MAECATHGTYHGTVVVIAGAQHGPTCPDCHLEAMAEESRREAEQLAVERKRNQRNSLRQMLGYAGIPERFMERGFSNYRATTAGQAEALNQARRYAESFAAARRAGEGLLLIGPPGTGKTHLAAAAVKAIIRDGWSGLFVSTLAVAQAVKETYRRDAEISEREAIRRFATPDLLVLDEVGVQHCTDTERVILTDLVNQRYEAMRPTVLISNLPPKASKPGELDLGKVLGPRVMSRLREVSEVIVCDWEDYRERAA